MGVGVILGSVILGMSSLYKGESKDIAVWRIREKVLS